MFEKTVDSGDNVIRQGDDGDNFYVIDRYLIQDAHYHPLREVGQVGSIFTLVSCDFSSYFLLFLSLDSALNEIFSLRCSYRFARLLLYEKEILLFSSGAFHIYVTSETEPTARLVGQYEGSGSFGELALMYNMPRAATVQV